MAPRADRLDLIYQAFCDAFNLETLRRMVWLKLGRTLDNYAAPGNFPQVVFELLAAASRDGFLDELVIAAREVNPGNEALAKLPPTRGEELRYLRRLIEYLEEKAKLYSPLRGIAAMSPEVKAEFPMVAWGQEPPLAALLRRKPGKPAMPERREGERYDDILGAYQSVSRVALLGAPGAGKSTVLRTLAVRLARVAVTDPDAPFPVLAALGEWTDEKPLQQFLTQTVGFPVEGLNKTRLVLLLDELHLVPMMYRAKKAGEVRKLCEGLPKSGKILVSCRLGDYTGDLDLGLDTWTLDPLSPQQVRTALRQWSGGREQVANTFFWQLAGDERLAEVWRKWESAGASEEEFWSVADPQNFDRWTSDAEDELWRRNIPNVRSLVRLAANPFLLTALAIVRRTDVVLPPNRSDLLRRLVDTLLSREKLLLEDQSTGHGGWNRTERGC